MHIKVKVSLRRMGAMACLAGLLLPAVQAMEAGPPLVFKPGTAAQRATLAKIPELRDLVAEAFATAGADLDDDGHQELVVISRSSAFCGSGGCMTVVVQARDRRAHVLLTQNLMEPLALTREAVGGYRALAAVDEQGRIQMGNKPGTPLFGKPMVYPMAVAAAAAQVTPTVPAAAPVQSAPAPAAVPAPAAGVVPDLLGIGLGRSLPAEVRSRLETVKGRGTNVQSTEVELTVATPARPRIKIEGSAHVRSVMLSGGNANNLPLDRVAVFFAPPPGPNVALLIDRGGWFAPVGLQAFEASLQAKWGAAWSRRNVPGKFGEWVWAWDANGKLLPPERAAKCQTVKEVKVANGSDHFINTAGLLENDCAYAIYLLARIDNDTVRETSTKAFAALVSKQAFEQTRQWVDQVQARELAADRGKAAGNALPRQ